MCADALLGHADGLADIFHGVEFQGIHTHVLANHLDHAVVFGCIGGLVGAEFLWSESVGGDALQLFDDAAGDELTVGLGLGEVEEGAAVDQRGAGDADVDLLGAVVVEHLHVVAQLGAADDGVVAEDHLLG